MEQDDRARIMVKKSLFGKNSWKKKRKMDNVPETKYKKDDDNKNNFKQMFYWVKMRWQVMMSWLDD